jgi:hypothetical protein
MAHGNLLPNLGNLILGLAKGKEVGKKGEA